MVIWTPPDRATFNRRKEKLIFLGFVLTKMALLPLQDQKRQSLLTSASAFERVNTAMKRLRLYLLGVFDQGRELRFEFVVGASDFTLKQKPMFKVFNERA